jgi:transcriptional regulator NrdR family protein
MTFQILPATVSDGPAIARIIVRSYMDDAFAKACYKTFTAEDRIESCKARFPRSLTSKNSWHLKVVDENGETISYSRWKLPEELWQTLRKENADMIEEVSAEDKERYEQEYAKNHIDDWPIGINKDMVMPMEASMDEARKMFPTGPSIC